MILKIKDNPPSLKLRWTKKVKRQKFEIKINNTIK
jgi:hypothetical protein